MVVEVCRLASGVVQQLLCHLKVQRGIAVRGLRDNGLQPVYGARGPLDRVLLLALIQATLATVDEQAGEKRLQSQAGLFRLDGFFTELDGAIQVSAGRLKSLEAMVNRRHQPTALQLGHLPQTDELRMIRSLGLQP